MNEAFEKRDELLKLIDEYCCSCCPKNCQDCPIEKSYRKILYGDFDNDLEND